MRLPPSGVAVVPAELMGRLQRQWVWFVVLAVVSLLLAGSSIAGWLLYIRASRTQGVPPADLVKLQGEVTGLQNSLGDREKDIADRQGRLDRVQDELDDTIKALAKAEARLVGTDDLRNSDQSRVTAAERDRANAQAKAEATDRVKTEIETKLAAADRTRVELETKLAAAEAGRSDAESKLAAASKALAAAELQAGDAQRAVDSLKEQAARLEADVQRYREEAQEARAEERKAVAKWQEAMTARVAGESARPGTAAPSAPDTARLTSETPPGAPPRVEPPLARVAPARPVPPVVQTQPASAPAKPTEGTIVTAVIGRDPSAAQPKPADDADDPALKDAKPPEIRGWGEAMIVGGNPERAVTLIRKAMEKGGEGAGYQKSLGWALLQAGREQEGKAALEAALTGFEDWAASSAKASPDHWTAAFLLGRVPEVEYTRRYIGVTLLGYRLDCLPWFYVGQRREMEGHREEALTAYRACAELGQLPNAYPIWKWASQRIDELAKPPATAPAQ